MCCNLLFVTFKDFQATGIIMRGGMSARERVRAILTDVFSIHRAIMFSSTPTAVSWRYQILARPRGWPGSIPALKPSQVYSDPLTDRLNYHLPSVSLENTWDVSQITKKKIKKLTKNSWLLLFIDTGCGMYLRFDRAGWCPCDVGTTPANCSSLWPLGLDHLAAHWSRQGLTLNGGGSFRKLGYSFL